MRAPRDLTRPKPRGRGMSRFKTTETARLIRATVEAGLQVHGIEVDVVGGTLRVLAESPKVEQVESG